jgi:hypothetical protein
MAEAKMVTNKIAKTTSAALVTTSKFAARTALLAALMTGK